MSAEATAGTRGTLGGFFARASTRPEYLIAEGGAYAGTNAHS